MTDLNAAGAVSASYAPGAGIDEPLASTSAAGTAFFQADGLGSVTSLSGMAGITDTYTYNGFGVTTATGSNPNRFRYTGREWDSETGLYYYRARYYDPQVGRFLSEDPIGMNGGINVHDYVENDPVNLNDPLGLQALPKPVPIPKPGPQLVPKPPAAPNTSFLGDVLGVIGIILGLEGQTASEAYDNIQYAWWAPLVKSPNFDPYKEPGRCKNQNGCKPCVPPVGTITYQPNSPTGGSHYPFGPNHWHLWEVHQSPPSAGCQCFWVELGVGTGTPPNVAQPYTGPAQGGGAQ